jgi:hypothetical protein
MANNIPSTGTALFNEWSAFKKKKKIFFRILLNGGHVSYSWT